jgi:hypothetical protein
MKHLHTDTFSAEKDWDSVKSGPKKYKQFYLYNLTSKGKEAKLIDFNSFNERKKSTKKYRKGDENDIRSSINKRAQENRRLQTEHVR